MNLNQVIYWATRHKNYMYIDYELMAGDEIQLPHTEVLLDDDILMMSVWFGVCTTLQWILTFFLNSSMDS